MEHCRSGSRAGDTSEEVMPFVYYNVAAGEKIARVSANMAMAADMEVRASSTSTTGAYSSACQRGLPAILMERGGGGRFTDSEVQAYKQDVKNIMIRMGLLSGEEVHTVQQKNVTRASGGRDRWIVVSGIFRRRYVRGRCGSGNGERYLGKPFTGVSGRLSGNHSVSDGGSWREDRGSADRLWGICG